MYILSKKRNEIVKIDISGRIFVRGGVVCCGKADEKPYYLGDYESEEQAKVALKMLFDALKNPRGNTLEMPSEKDVKAAVANIGQDIERHHVTGKKVKGHGGS